MSDQEDEEHTFGLSPDEFEVIDRRFTYHPPASDRIVRLHEKLREEGATMAELLLREVPDCRERELALQKLEEAVSHANAAVARELSRPHAATEGTA